MKHSAAEIIREYGPFPDVDDVHGVTFDGKRVWFASGERLHALDPDNGDVSRSLDIPANAGTAFDGKHLYQIADGTIRKIDPTTGAVIAEIPAPGDGEDSGLAWAEGSLWVGQHSGRKIHQVDPQTGEVLRTIETDGFVTGVTWSTESFGTARGTTARAISAVSTRRQVKYSSDWTCHPEPTFQGSNPMAAIAFSVEAETAEK